MKISIILHANCVEQGQTIDEMCAYAVKWGYDGIEFRSKRTGGDETRDNYLDAIARARDRHGLREVCFGSPGPNLMQPDAGARQRATDEYAAFLRTAASRLGVKAVNTFAGQLLNPAPHAPLTDSALHGSAIATEAHYAWAAEGFRQLGPVAEELGLRLALETQRGYLHDTPASALKLVNLIGHAHVGINLDCVCISGQPNPPSVPEILAMLAGHIYYVHLRNICRLASREALRVGLGDGEINHRLLLRLLLRQGYAGPLCIESPRSGDREWFARQDIAYLRTVLAEIDSAAPEAMTNPARPRG